MSHWSSRPIPGSSGGYQQKPDLILVNEATTTFNEVTWQSPKVIGEYTKESFQPAKHLGKTMDLKAYLVFLEQPWRWFVLGLSICSAEELHVHFYNCCGSTVSLPFSIHKEPLSFVYILSAISFGCHSGIGFDTTMQIQPLPAQIHSLFSDSEALHQTSPAETSSTPLLLPEPLLSTSPTQLPTSLPTVSSDDAQPTPTPLQNSCLPIGKMQVGEDWYELIKILFLSPGFLGRGTVCYLAWKDGVYYIIKDYWVLASTPWDLLNEVNMMTKLMHINGIPKLHAYWFVPHDNEDDSTARYRAPRWQKNMKSQ